MAITSSEQLWRNLPAFLKRKGQTGMPWLLCQGLAAAFDLLAAATALLRVRGAANRLSGYSTYYASQERKDDMARLGMSRLLSKRSNESWAEFETRLQENVGLEVWDGTRVRYSLTGDVSQWGTVTGIIREVERTGLKASLVATRLDPLAWRLLDTDGRGGTDESELLDDSEPPEGQRLTRIWDDGWLWGFWLYVTNPDVVDYLADEVRNIVRDTKPAWVRCYLGLPDAESWEVID